VSHKKSKREGISKDDLQKSRVDLLLFIIFWVDFERFIPKKIIFLETNKNLRKFTLKIHSKFYRHFGSTSKGTSFGVQKTPKILPPKRIKI